ncbi:MAG: hypothetical protein ACRD2A_13545, partial [Vicinamibacterales bacterium]
MIGRLRLTTIRAAVTTGFVELVSRVSVGVLSIAIARTMEPHDVGILGVAIIIMALVSMVGFYPETAAVVARGDVNDDAYALVATGIRGGVV